MERRSTTNSPQEVLVLCRERGVKAADLRFTDFIGRQHHTTIPISQLTDTSFEDGFGVDGTCMAGLRGLEDADLLLVPQPQSAWIDPFATHETIVLTCSILDPVTREEHARDPRNITRRAENYLQQTGVADAALLGLECEFFIFDSVNYDQTVSDGFYSIEKVRVSAASGHASGDLTADLRCQMMQQLIECGIDVESHQSRGEPNAGQAMVSLRFQPLLEICDSLMHFKAIVKSVACKAGHTATFMPMPIAGSGGNGLHVHLSLWKSGEPLFAGTGYAGLNERGLNAIGGILKHAPALAALTNPTTNSYRRLRPGNQAPVHLGYSQANRSAACRIPMISPSPKSKRIEFRCPDPSCNPYLAFSAILMAVIDGIQNKIHPGESLDERWVDQPHGALVDIPQMPHNLETALESLEQDCDFLLRGDVFPEDGLRNWIAHKRNHEIAPLGQRPHPYEFCLYYDT